MFFMISMFSASYQKFITILSLFSRHESQGDEPTTTLAGLLTTSGYSNDITKNANSGDGKASSRESRGERWAVSFDTEFHPWTWTLAGRSVGGGPMRSRSRNIDTSPYSSNNTAYLSPPESSWRRTSSDSAIHQSLAQAQVRIVCVSSGGTFFY